MAEVLGGSRGRNDKLGGSKLLSTSQRAAAGVHDSKCSCTATRCSGTHPHVLHPAIVASAHRSWGQACRSRCWRCSACASASCRAACAHCRGAWWDSSWNSWAKIFKCSRSAACCLAHHHIAIGVRAGGQGGGGGGLGGTQKGLSPGTGRPLTARGGLFGGGSPGQPGGGGPANGTGVPRMPPPRPASAPRERPGAVPGGCGARPPRRVWVCT